MPAWIRLTPRSNQQATIMLQLANGCEAEHSHDRHTKKNGQRFWEITCTQVGVDKFCHGKVWTIFWLKTSSENPLCRFREPNFDKSGRAQRSWGKEKAWKGTTGHWWSALWSNRLCRSRHTNTGSVCTDIYTCSMSNAQSYAIAVPWDMPNPIAKGKPQPSTHGSPLGPQEHKMRLVWKRREKSRMRPINSQWQWEERSWCAFKKEVPSP